MPKNSYSTHFKRIQIVCLIVLTPAILLLASLLSPLTDDASADTGDTPVLKWAPPELDNPTVRLVNDDADKDFYLENGVDYIIEMPDHPVMQSMRIFGGRNVVLIGGEIFIPDQGPNASITSRTGLKILDFEQTETRTVHIEGLLIRGQDLTEGIQIDAPNAIVQIQNVRIEDIHARDQVDFSDNHPDLIQTYGSVKELRVDHFTGSTDYQGLFFKADYNPPHGSIRLSNINIIGRPTARYLIWFEVSEGAGDVTMENIWLSVPEERSGGLGNAVWPPIQNEYPDQAQLVEDRDCECVTWPKDMQPFVEGYIRAGVPEDGDFVIASDVGIAYKSPGYADEGAE